MVYFQCGPIGDIALDPFSLNSSSELSSELCKEACRIVNCNDSGGWGRKRAFTALKFAERFFRCWIQVCCGWLSSVESISCLLFWLLIQTSDWSSVYWCCSRTWLNLTAISSKIYRKFFAWFKKNNEPETEQFCVNRRTVSFH